MSRKTVLLLTLALSFLRIAAQDFTVSRRICSADGLSNDFVTKIAVDGEGYVWTAGESGVNRITGSSCQTFLVSQWPPEGNFMQLADNARRVPGQKTRSSFGLRTTALRWHQPTGMMLIGTEYGLIAYNKRLATVRFLTSQDGLEEAGIEDIVDAPDGIYLIYANGRVQHFDCATFKATSIKQQSAYHTACGACDISGHIYVGYSKDGMSIIDIRTGKTRRFLHEAGNAASLPGNNVRCIYRDRSNRIWVGTDGGAALFHPSSGTFTLVSGDRSSKENVYDIHQMRDGSLWVATDMGGIRVINPDQNVTDGRMRYSATRVESSSLNTRAVVQDDYGNIWIGNHSTGVDFISGRRPEFSLLHPMGGILSDNMLSPVYSIAKDRDGGLWTAGAQGLTLWRGNEIVNTWRIDDVERNSPSYIRSVLPTRDGEIWLGIDDRGLARFDRKSGKYEFVALPGMTDRDIHTLSEDGSGRIWIGSENGTYSYTKSGGGKLEDVINKVTDYAIVTSFLWLSDDVVFLTTYGMGAFTINLTTGKSVKLGFADGLPSVRINQAISDGKGGLWLATHHGLVHVDNAMTLRGITPYSSEHGLADSYICSLTADNSGRIWMSTFSGISCFDSKTKQIYNYNYLDIGHPCGFYACGITSDKNWIYVCGTSGVVRFSPQSFDRHEQVSDVQIISCEAYSPDGMDTKIMLLTPDDEGIYRTGHQQNTLRLSFCVRNQAQSPYVEYSYMMKGMDDKWYYIGSDNDVVFRGLPPGRYTFILRAKLKSQDWSDASTCEMTIRIAPPLWQTWWAYLLYAVVIAFATYYFVRSYKSRLKLRGRLELEKRENIQKQRANEERLHFFTNITHELRTPLTLIIGPLNDLADDDRLPPDGKRRVGVIRKNAERLKDLISQLLEFRKTETNNRKLTVARSNIGQFVKELCLNYKELNSNRRVDFEYDIAQDLPEVYFDSEVVTTILNNILSNAVKYTEQGSITTTVREDGDRIVISVADTGYGISAEALPHIFERYYQASGDHQASGTGIGLALAKALADLHEAQIYVESTEGKGSTFTLSLSTTNTYPNALHKEDAPHAAAMHGDTVADDAAAPPDDGKNVLLVVEDNADIREYIADSFSDDFTILQAENGEEGLRLATQNIPDIIVSDIMMPRMDGNKLTRALKEDIRTSHIPVILLTAKVADDDKEEGYRSGADSYLTKPFTAKLLGSRIENLLTMRRRMAENILRYAQDTGVDGTKEERGDVKGDDGEIKEEGREMSALDRHFLERLNGVIRDNIMSDDLDMPFITKEMAMSHSTFYRKVKALTGMTAKEYVRKFRLRYCLQLLESGDYNVTEAAMMAGFNQMAHFRQTFKNEFGMLPSEVKKRLRN